MPAAAIFGADGKKAGEVELAPEIFDIQVNVPVLHEVVRAQLAAARAGTHSTKTRGEVRGGGRKPWRQKGTGNARHGSIREPQWVGGGVAHGPKPRDHSFRVNRKTRTLALRSALTDRARQGKVIVAEIPTFEEPATQEAVQLLEQWGAEGRTLLVASRTEEEPLDNVWKSFRNLPDVLTVSYPTAYTVLAADTIIFTKTALGELTSANHQKESEATEAGATPAGLSTGRKAAKEESDAVPDAPAGTTSTGRKAEDGSAVDSRALRALPASEIEPGRARAAPADADRAGSSDEDKS